MHPVKGKITLDGKPLPDAGVIFIPYGPTLGSGSQALTDAEGNYELVTQMTDEYGAAEGEHQVLISKLNGKPGVAETGANETLPARYSNPRDLELRAIVKPEPNVFNFDLTVKKQ